MNCWLKPRCPSGRRGIAGPNEGLNVKKKMKPATIQISRVAQRGADGARRSRSAARSRCAPPLAHERARHDQRDSGKHAGHQERDDQARVAPPGSHREADQHGRDVIARPLHRLEGPGQPVRASVFDHDRVGQHVGEGQAEPHRGEEHEQRARSRHGIRGPAARKPPRRPATRSGRDSSDPPPSEDRHEVGEQPVDWLDQPGIVAISEEVGDCARRCSRASLNTIVIVWLGRVPHALREVDDPEEERQPAAPRPS